MNRRRTMNGKTITFLIFILLIPLSLFIMSCDVLTTQVDDVNPDDNPIDPDNPDFIPPTTTLISAPDEGEIISVDNVTFKWRGNDPSCTFSYHLNNEIWSEWTQDTLVTYTYLDEGEYIFSVKSCYPTGVEEDPEKSVSFTIDAVKGPALRFYKKKVETPAGSNFQIEVWAEEVSELAIISINIDFNTNYLQVQNLNIYNDETAFLRKNGGNIIEVHNFDNSNGNITVYLSRTDTDPLGVDGSGALFIISFTAKSRGTTNITFDNGCYFRKANNNPIEIISKVSSLIEIS